MKNKDEENKFLVSFSDILRLFQQSKKIILCCGLAFGILGILFALTRPVRYEAEGTFREKGMKANAVSSSIHQLLGSNSIAGAESEAGSLMASRRILKGVVNKLQLQGQLNPFSEIETKSNNAKHNFRLAVASAFGEPTRPVLEDRSCPLKIQSLAYTGEIPAAFSINLQKDGTFEVSDLSNRGHKPAAGKLGEPFKLDELVITLTSVKPGEPITPLYYHLKVDPLQNTVQELRKNLQVEPGKQDKSLLTLRFKHRDRQLASGVVNAIMESYQNYLKDYHAEIALNQLEYLNIRRDQLSRNLTTVMQNHADFLTDDISKSGFFDSEKEMDFLAKNLHENKKKLLDNELEVKRLKNIEPGSLAYYDRYAENDGDPFIINTVLSEMRALKYQREALEIELQKKSNNQGTELQHSFEERLKELKEVQQGLKELTQIKADFESGSFPDPNLKLYKDPRFLLRSWFERLQNSQGESSDHFKKVKENFAFYLNNLESSFDLHERILQERLTRQQNSSGEYQGMSLEAATELYLEYSKELINLEGMIRKNLFFIAQIEDPHFEITSLSAGLDDPVSTNMIEKASDLVLTLRDQNNQSMKEQERIKEELNLQRTFLTLHLKQMVELMELHKQLIDEKIFALQHVSLELIHQKISLLEKNLQDYLKSRLNNLQQERTLIQRHLESIHAEMASIPQKWVSENLLTQEVATNQKIVEEIAKLVESKNISHKLDVIQSSPIDFALPPVHPNSPKVFLWGILGFLLGGALGSCFVLGRSLKNGLGVTAENLDLMGFHVSGRLRENENYDVLRWLQAYFDGSFDPEEKKGTKKLLLLEGRGPDYAPDLADLLLKRGSRVITLDLNFNDPDKIAAPGLLQYLQGTIDHLPLRQGTHGDWMTAGGATPFGVELINSPKFKELMLKFEQDYDSVLAVSRAMPTSGEGQSLLTLFPNAVITINQETIDDLAVFTKILDRYPEHRFTFLLNEEAGLPG